MLEKHSDIQVKISSIVLDFPAPEKEHYKEAVRLLQEDKYLTPHDALIVARAFLIEILLGSSLMCTKIHSTRLR